MQSLASAFLLVVTISTASALIRAGAAKVNASLPIGVPLAGYNHGTRRVPDWPIPKNTQYTTYMMPSTGRLDDTNMRALVLDFGSDRTYYVTVDAIGADGTLRQLCVQQAQALGSQVTLKSLTLHASHTHSGPGAVSPEWLWALAPATDVMVPELQLAIANSCASAIILAESNLRPAQLGIGSSELYNVTVNRRAKISPYVTPDSIDPHLGIIRVDQDDGTPMATLWNFAIHGTCWGPDQMSCSSDIMGGVNKILEDEMNLGVALFVNGDAGDIDPSPATCANKPNYDGAPIIAKKIQSTRSSIQADTYQYNSISLVQPFGLTDLNVTLQRFANCTEGGPVDICTFCKTFKCDINAHLNGGWVEELPRFTARSFTVGTKKTVMVTLPGEALFALGEQVRSDAKGMGFDDVFLLGYSQNHMGYFTTPEEYDVGGYESELTFWGYNTSLLVRKGAHDAMYQLAN